MHAIRSKSGAETPGEAKEALKPTVAGHKRAQDQLSGTLKELSDYKFALDQATVVAFTDANGVITYANDRFCQLSGYSRQELIGQTHRILKSGHHPPEFYRELWNTITQGGVWRGEIVNRARDGTLYWTLSTIVPFLDAHGKPYQYVAIRSDITQLKHMEEQRLECLRTQASLASREEEVRARDEFISIASHELKSPLGGVSLLAQLLMREVQRFLPDESAKQHLMPNLDRLNRQTMRVVRLIDEMFDSTRIRTGQLELQPAMTDLAEVVDDLLVQLEEDIHSSGSTVSLVKQESLVGWWDRARIEQVVRNMLSNALKYGGGQSVEISLASFEGQARLEVRDHGIGIPPDELPHLFQPYERAKGARGYKGLGLGLWIAREIVSRHGGTILLASDVGTGTCATLTLPLTQAPTAA